MGLSVTTANPGTISSVGNANPGTITSVGNATPGNITSVDVAHPGTLTNLQPTTSFNGQSYGSSSQDTAALIAAILKASKSPPPVYAPKIDIAAINAQARAAAENAVNPYYTKTLNDYLAQQANLKSQQQQQTATNIQNLQDVLANTLGGNQLTGQRTAEDTATKIAQTNQQADQFQTDSGTAADATRIQLAKSASGGGLGQQKIESAVNTNNTQEARQSDQFQQAKDQAELFKSRTFEDLAKSSELAKQTETKGEAQQNFDLTNFITNQNADISAKSSDIEKARLQDAAANEAAQRSLLVSKWIESIANPAQRAAAYTQYAGYL